MTSPLNSTETQTLRDIAATLDYVAEHGYRPDDAEMRDAQAIFTKTHIDRSRKYLRDIISKKGHFST